MENQNGNILDMQTIKEDPLIVEVKFKKSIDKKKDVDTLIEEASSYLKKQFPGRSTPGAYFVNCYDNLDISRETADYFQRKIIEFNEKHSLGDVRYGCSSFSASFLISTAIKTSDRSNIYDSREEALEAIRDLAQN